MQNAVLEARNTTMTVLVIPRSIDVRVIRLIYWSFIDGRSKKILTACFQISNVCRWIIDEELSHDWSISPSFKPLPAVKWKSFLRFLIDSKDIDTPTALATK